MTFSLITFLVLAFSPAAHANLSAIQTPEDKILAKGFSAFMDNNNRAALSYFEEVIRINPKNTAAQRGLEKVKIRLKKIEDVNKSQARALAKAKINEGRGMLNNGDVVGAIDSFHAAMDAYPENSQAKKELGAIRTKNLSISEKKKFNPSTWAFSRGVIAYLDRDWAKAYRIWSERLKLEPTNVVLANATARSENNFKKMMLSEQEDFFRRGGRAFYEQGLYQQSKNAWSKVLSLREEDQEALEGYARAEEALLRAQGKGRDDKAHDLLEEGLEYYATQNWNRAMDTFQRLAQISPEYQNIAGEYVSRIKARLSSADYTPIVSGGVSNWRPNKPSNQEGAIADIPDKFENFADRIKDLQAQLNRDPSNIRVQQELDKVKKAQDDESERIYKDGLIAYSQGNRDLAIQHWKQVLIINPDHKKASAALRKARAEEDRKE